MNSLPLRKLRILLACLILVLPVAFNLLMWSSYPLPETNNWTPSRVHNNASSIKRSPLYDETLYYDWSLNRLWLSSNSTSYDEPPVMLLITSFGFNHPNQTYGKSLYRGLRMTELMEGIINHPWFHPTAWIDIQEGRMNISKTTRYYVFIDQDTCMEKNYPYYNHGIVGNSDHGGGRTGEVQNYWQHRVQEVLSSKLFTQAAVAQYIVWECSGGGPKSAWHNARVQSHNSTQLVWATLSSHVNMVQPQDVGLPPPAGNPCRLTPQQRNNLLYNCQESQRTILLSFLGNVYRKHVRRQLAKMNNNSTIVVRRGNLNSTAEFQDLAFRSVFGAVPRGDDLFSYRFTEVLSCGAIPVVYADGWMLPLNLNWSRAAIILPEQDVDQSVNILNNISNEERCRLSQEGFRYYERYLRNGRAVIQGIVDRLERQVQNCASRL